MRTALLTPTRLLSAIVALTILCMFAVSIVTDHLAGIFLSTSDFNSASHLHLISEVTVALRHAQDCRTQYLATGNPAYLDAYRSACSDVDYSMDRLVSEDYDVSAKLAHAQGLRQFVHSKLAEIGKALQATPAGATPGNGDLITIQNLLGSLAQEESHDISKELQAAQERTRFHHNLVIALAAINIFFLGGVSFCAIQIRKLHSLITMCAWSKRVQFQGNWVPLEEYMRKRFGIRISHGISQEEYEKWYAPEKAAEAKGAPAAPDTKPAPAEAPKAAA